MSDRQLAHVPGVSLPRGHLSTQRSSTGPVLPWDAHSEYTYSDYRVCCNVLMTLLSVAVYDGRDKHFRRGEDRYQQFIGDPDVTPNPCMGPVKESPFYAIRIFPGDAGTRGGLLTDEFARVLRKNGDVIHGLFAGQ